MNLKDIKLETKHLYYVFVPFILTIAIIFLNDRIKFKKNKQYNALQDIYTKCVFLFFMTIKLYTILYLINTFMMKNDDFFQNGSLMINSTIVMLLFSVITLIMKKALFSSFMTNNENVNKRMLFIIPIFNIVITVIYVLNQLTDYFVKLDIIGPLFNIIKLKEEHFNIVEKVVYYSIIENAVIILYILIITYGTDPETMKTICGNNTNQKVNKQCGIEIADDVYMYASIIRVIFIILYFLYSILTTKVLQIKNNNGVRENKNFSTNLESIKNNLSENIPGVEQFVDGVQKQGELLKSFGKNKGNLLKNKTQKQGELLKSFGKNKGKLLKSFGKML